jgi:LysR family hydrogen peroxide-inducible transcriptional activator
MVTLKQLRYFEMLARHRHFGRAAEDCAVTQPALSMQIRELESFLGAKLVERRAGELVLTELGADVARRGAHILAAVHDLTEHARHSGRLLCGPLRLGVIPTLAPYLLPRILPVVQKRHRDLRLELRESQTGTLVSELVRGHLDAIIIALPEPHPEIDAVPVFNDPFLLAIPVSDALSPRARITSKDVDAGRLILLEEGHCLRDQTLAFCGATNGSGHQELSATSLTTVMQMVANGYGITLVPEIAVPVEARDERIRLVRFAKPEPTRTIGLAWRRTTSRKQDFVVLADEVAQTIGSGSGRRRVGRPVIAT